MNWLFGYSTPAPPEPQPAAAPADAAAKGAISAPGPGVALDLLSIREGESLTSAKLGEQVQKGTLLTVIELKGRRALVQAPSGLRGWVSVHQPDGVPLVAKVEGAASPPSPPKPGSPKRKVVDGAALAKRIITAYDDNGDGALNYIEMCAHEEDLGRRPPTKAQYEQTCVEQKLDPALGMTPEFLTGLLSRVTPEQEGALEHAISAREQELLSFAAVLSSPAFFTGYLWHEVAGWVSSGPAKVWVRLQDGELHLAGDPTKPPTATMKIQQGTTIEEAASGGGKQLKVTSGGRSVVFTKQTEADHALWAGFLALAAAQVDPGRRVPLAARARFRALLAGAPPPVPAFVQSLPEANQPARLHGYCVSCTYWSVLGPNWKRRYCTLHDGWWAIRESKDDAQGLVVMPLRHARLAIDSSQQHSFSITCAQGTYSPVTLWCDGVDQDRRWRAAFEREMARARGEGRLDWETLRKQDAACSNAFIVTLAGEQAFEALAAAEGQALIARDKEDDVKLQKGIDFSISRGVLEKIPPPKVTQIEVAGQTVDDVAAVITSKLPKGKGCVVVLQGMSGTGKSTLTKRLLAILPNSVGWSNGNVFRSLTLLAATHAEKSGQSLKANPDAVLTQENIAKWMGMLSFESAGGKYTIRIRGMGYDFTVDEVATTLLQEPRVAHNIPTVAEKTQGEVIKFAAAALKVMEQDGKNVVLEGRAATVQYVPTPYRFELVLNDPALLGQRRAAQRIMGALYKHFGKQLAAPSGERLRLEALAFCARETQSAAAR